LDKDLEAYSELEALRELLVPVSDGDLSHLSLLSYLALSASLISQLAAYVDTGSSDS
jgi:hypothetical protein